MNKCHILILTVSILISCKGVNSTNDIEQNKEVLIHEVVNELREMAKIDQIAAYIPQGKYENLSQEEWNSFKDSVFKTNQLRAEHLFNQHGFLGYDIVGEKGSQDFWLLVQHSDHNPKFQNEVLEKMKIEVDKNNADPNSFALLTDRVKINTEKKQIYGTQVDYNWKIAQAFPKNLADSASVNERRKSVGLEPIEIYLNRMSEMNFEMNKKGYLKNGINEPKLYKVD